ncbi:MAG: extracellular solute-binding protein [Candidatus Saccharibacteria bacterium]
MKHRYLKLTALILCGLIIATLIYVLTQSSGLFTSPSIEYQSKVVYPTSPITLSYWLPSDEASNLDAVLANYKKLHPNVTVNITYIDPANYQAKVLQAQAAGSLPDMFGFRNDGLPLYQKSLQPAPESVITAEQFNQTFADFASKSLVSGKNIYGMPFGIATLGLFYNTDAFKKANISSPPSTWQEFDKANSSVRNKQGQTLYSSGAALGTAAVHSYPDIISMFMMQNGAVMTNSPPTKATFQLADSTGYSSGSKALEYYASFAQPSKENYTWSDALGSSVTAFATGKTQMMIDYPMVAKTLRKQNTNLPFTMVALPQTNPKTPLNYGVIFTQGVSKTSKNSEIAWDFLGFATSKNQQLLYSQASLWPAARRDLVAQQYNDKDLAPFARQIATASDWYRGINYATNNNLREMVSNYLAGYDSKIATNLAAAAVTLEIQKSLQ